MEYTGVVFAQEQERMFVDQSRTETRDPHDVKSLLPFAREIIEAHGGSIEMVSRAADNRKDHVHVATFRIVLPIRNRGEVTQSKA
jgi:hypothetical protein